MSYPFELFLSLQPYCSLFQPNPACSSLFQNKHLGTFGHVKMIAHKFCLKCYAPHSLFAKLWFVRPMIVESVILLLDIFQMSPLKQVSHFRWGRSMFLKKVFFENYTLRGVNIGIMQFHTQFVHVSRHFWEYKINRKSLENCFENVVSDLWKIA